MAERFRDPVKAAQYLAQAVRHDFPDAITEVVRFTRRRAKEKKCHTDDIEHVLVDSCRSFRDVDVEYHPKNAYGLVAQVREHTGGRVEAKHASETGRLYILILQVKGRAIAVGSRPAPRLAFDLE